MWKSSMGVQLFSMTKCPLYPLPFNTACVYLPVCLLSPFNFVDFILWWPRELDVPEAGLVE